MVLGMIALRAALAGLLDLDHFAAFVVAAFGADTMRQLALVTVRTLGE